MSDRARLAQHFFDRRFYMEAQNQFLSVNSLSPWRHNSTLPLDLFWSWTVSGEVYVTVSVRYEISGSWEQKGSIPRAMHCLVTPSKWFYIKKIGSGHASLSLSLSLSLTHTHTHTLSLSLLLLLFVLVPLIILLWSAYSRCAESVHYNTPRIQRRRWASILSRGRQPTICFHNLSTSKQNCD